MYVCGVDDAGRGSVLGPLVIAGILIHHSKLQLLKSMGVRDSKRLTKQSRHKLYNKIIDLADDYYVAKISAKKIDRYVYQHNLNLLEAEYMGKTISALKPQISYIDSCDVNAIRFGNIVSRLSNSKIFSLHHADSKLIVVSAASIIAKVTRDNIIIKLQKKYNVGSGYPSDMLTHEFIENCIKNKVIPYFVRNSWKTVRSINNLYHCRNFASIIK